MVERLPSLERIKAHAFVKRRALELQLEDNCRARRYNWKRRQTDPGFKLLLALRCRVYAALKGGLKRHRFVTLIGCTPAKLRRHLERQFKNGMSWDNHGAWEMDHIKPCKAFNLADPAEQLRCFHYTNLQPLWKSENRRKRSRFSEQMRFVLNVNG